MKELDKMMIQSIRTQIETLRKHIPNTVHLKSIQDQSTDIEWLADSLDALLENVDDISDQIISILDKQTIIDRLHQLNSSKMSVSELTIKEVSDLYNTYGEQGACPIHDGHLVPAMIPARVLLKV